MSKAKTVGLWILTVALGLMFLGAGGTKLAAMSPNPENFAAMGLPLWFMYCTGAIEVTAALLVFVPRTATLGAGLVFCTMVGALLVLLKIGDTAHLANPILPLVLSVAVGLARRRDLLAPFNRFFVQGETVPQVQV
ncbi:MAG TPA: DoxX family protein [Archangium sp.]|jgi:uncharacterized membrane protein YphA (DoxX/SURF4 family)|uniref:DoxX family protein n=1 Tax=Archangium sp. TaxID=1872627 RepID=UPI002ED7BF31